MSTSTALLATARAGDRDDLARFPAHPVDPSKVGAMFERFGLPGRLD